MPEDFFAAGLSDAFSAAASSDLPSGWSAASGFGSAALRVRRGGAVVGSGALNSSMVSAAAAAVAADSVADSVAGLPAGSSAALAATFLVVVFFAVDFLAAVFLAAFLAAGWAPPAASA